MGYIVNWKWESLKNLWGILRIVRVKKYPLAGA